MTTEEESEVDKFLIKEGVTKHMTELVDEDILKELTSEIATTNNPNAHMTKMEEKASDHASNYDNIPEKSNQWSTTRIEEEIPYHVIVPENMQVKTSLARQKEWLEQKNTKTETTPQETLEEKKNLDKRKKYNNDKKLEKMNLRKPNQSYLKNIYSCKICLSTDKNFMGRRKKDLKKHITNDHKPITPQDYKSIFERTETSIMRRWKRKNDNEITRGTIRLLMGKVRSYTRILYDELRGLEMTSNEITPALKLEFIQEAIPLEMLSRLLKIYASDY